MINLEDISTASSHYEWTEKLWIDSFPVDERRDTCIQRKNIDSNPKFRCKVALNGYDEPIGFITIWDLGLFIYCEHFATAPKIRGKGFGTEIIRMVTSFYGKPLVLEVEMPENELSRRRIRFYERCGLRLWKSGLYTQPPYRPGGNPVPMMLMATDGLTEAKDFNQIVDILKKEVYGVRSCI